MRIQALSALVLCAAPLCASITGPAFGLTGAPGEGNCTACHFGAPLNQGGGELKIELLSATTYTPGVQHRIRITLSDPAARRWGFQLTARRTNAPTERAGTLASENVQLIQVGNDAQRNVQFASHTLEGTRPNVADQAVWELLWTAPAAGFGSVTFYAAGNAANNNINTSGDNIYTSSLQAGESSAGPELTSFVLPQFVYGPQDANSRWSTQLYLQNSGEAPAGLELHFRDDSGADLGFPGGAQQNRTLAAGETLLGAGDRPCDREPQRRSSQRGIHGAERGGPADRKRSPCACAPLEIGWRAERSSRIERCGGSARVGRIPGKQWGGGRAGPAIRRVGVHFGSAD
jgi:hypothetical protein